MPVIVSILIFINTPIMWDIGQTKQKICINRFYCNSKMKITKNNSYYLSANGGTNDFQCHLSPKYTLSYTHI